MSSGIRSNFDSYKKAQSANLSTSRSKKVAISNLAAKRSHKSKGTVDVKQLFAALKSDENMQTHKIDF